MRLVLVLALWAGCYAPGISDGQYTCDDGKCPSGFECTAVGQAKLCCRPGSTSCGADQGVASGSDLSAPPDLASPPDLATPPDMTLRVACSNGGARAAGDPGLASVALCPAAWRVPGVSSAAGMATPCNRKPIGDGSDGQGHDCSAEDNCAPGWHLCALESELSSRGMTRAHCEAVGAGALFVTRLLGANVTQGPPTCSTTTMPRFVFGCGGEGQATDQCQILTHALVSPPGSGSDGCASATSNAFLCTGASMTVAEVTVVTKPSLAGGGVLCCAE